MTNGSLQIMLMCAPGKAMTTATRRSLSVQDVSYKWDKKEKSSRGLTKVVSSQWLRETVPSNLIIPLSTIGHQRLILNRGQA